MRSVQSWDLAGCTTRRFGRMARASGSIVGLASGSISLCSILVRRLLLGCHTSTGDRGYSLARWKKVDVLDE